MSDKPVHDYVMLGKPFAAMDFRWRVNAQCRNCKRYIVAQTEGDEYDLKDEIESANGQRCDWPELGGEWGPRRRVVVMINYETKAYFSAARTRVATWNDDRTWTKHRLPA